MAQSPAGRVEQQIATLLTEYPGHAFCDACLAQKLALDVALVAHASAGLAQARKFHGERWFCSFCLRTAQVIHVPWLETGSRPEPPPATASDALRFQLRPGA